MTDETAKSREQILYDVLCNHDQTRNSMLFPTMVFPENITITDQGVEIKVGGKASQMHCEKQYGPAIKQLAVTYLGIANPSISFVIDPSLVRPKQTRQEAEKPEIPERVKPSTNHTLENFIIGPHNKSAATLVKMAITGESLFRNVFVFGPLGSGKTHLSRAHYIEQVRKGVNSHYTTAEAFSQAFVDSIMNHEGAGEKARFLTKLMQARLLVVDGVEKLTRTATKTQQALSGIIDQAVTRNAACIVTGNYQDGNMPNLLPELASKLQGFARVGLAYPDKQAAKDLVSGFSEHFAPELKVQSPAIDVLIDSVFKNKERVSPRELYGAFSTLAGYCLAHGLEASANAIRESLVAFRQYDGQETRVITLNKIVQAVAGAYGLDVRDIRSGRKNQPLPEARAYIAYLAREQTKTSYAEIARGLGSNNHTTAIGWIKRGKEIIKTPEGERKLAQLKAHLNSQP